MAAKLEGYREVLRREFNAEEGSFLIQLRSELTWDKTAFARLAGAMEACCAETSEKDMLERWLAHGFWFIPSFVRKWATHPNFPRPGPQEYYEQAFQRLDDLAFWFFFGFSPREAPQRNEP